MIRGIKCILIGTLVLFSSPLLASESYIIEPEEAVKLVNSKDIDFISLGDEKETIIKSKRVDVKELFEVDTLGNMKCEPFYVCPKRLKKYLESKGISSSQKLILYDNHYGINSATLYAILEATGNKNIQILNGGVKGILNLDPNQKIYDEYQLEKASLLSDKNSSSVEKLKSNLENIDKKLSLLKPLLLVSDVNNDTSKDKNVTYTLDRKNFNFNYLIGLDSLQKAVSKVRKEGKKSNIRIVDACSMVDIVGNRYGSYLSGVYSVDWKEIVDIKKASMQSSKDLEILFQKKGIRVDNEIYVYCMSDVQKAFYVGLALRRGNFSKVKVFSGDWNVWRGDISE